MEETKEVFSKSYASFSGRDVKCCFKFRDQEPFWVGETQAISFHEDFLTYEVKGTLVFIIFDKDPLERIRGEGPLDLILKMANEYGSLMNIVIHNVEFTRRHLGTSADDLIFEQSVDFAGVGVEFINGANL